MKGRKKTRFNNPVEIEEERMYVKPLKRSFPPFVSSSNNKYINTRSLCHCTPFHPLFLSFSIFASTRIRMGNETINEKKIHLGFPLFPAFPLSPIPRFPVVCTVVSFLVHARVYWIRRDEEREREESEFSEFITREESCKEEANLHRYRPSNENKRTIFIRFHACFFSI